MTEKPDYRATVFLPKTDFPMKAGLPQKEPGILARWQAEDLYRQLRDARAGREKFILHDGPPYANGDIHVGHALNHVLKDMIVRCQNLLGLDAPYVPGWDCHGLPIEWKVEEQYRKKKQNKDEVPAAEFRAECRAYASHWVDVQRKQLQRLGINGDWDHPYLTMDFAAEATIVGELMKFAESGQLYRGAKPVMWSPVEKTALAEAEVEYEDIVSTQVDVAFEIVESRIPELVGAYAVIWTTTPWTIPVNQAIAYGAEVEYVLIALQVGISGRYDPEADPKDEGYSHPVLAQMRGKKLLLAKNLVDTFLSRYINYSAAQMADIGQAAVPVPTIIRTIQGSNLAGTIALHPMAKAFTSPLPLAGGAGGGHLLSSSGVEEEESAHPSPSRKREGLTAPLPFRGGAGGGDSSAGARYGDRPHPNPSPEGEGLSSSIHPSSPLAEFFLRPRPFLDGSAFVTTESGTGLVHMAPDHGEDDFLLCKAHGIEPVFAVEADGKYRADWAWLGGEGSVINAKFNAPDGPICTALRKYDGLLAASADYKHSYPHSWRSKAKLIYRCTPQWFVPMDKPINDGKTLRETAVRAIADTRWIPEKGRNRIGAMVEGRPDWVLSRQRAWGVPITLFVHRQTGQYLCDPAVNARILGAIKAAGVDAWDEARAQEFLGNEYRAEDYERVTDILDVWFDSGSTHAFVLESGRWPDLTRPAGYTGPLADMYLEGSDQHRGWFQSSLLESCATRGHAPYKAVLTHGFTMDAKGMKMSKSLGNTIDPLKVMETNGADIIRLWALTVDYTEDHRIGDEILKGVADQYRKLRNSFRYLLGALDGFSEAERVEVSAMPELERYVLAQLTWLDRTLRQAVADYDFNTYVRSLTDFCNENLSAFFFDIRKDCLYCDAPGDPKRMAYRTVLDVLFHTLVRYAAPVLVFTAEEIWGRRYPDLGSVHLLEWPEIYAGWSDHGLVARWTGIWAFRAYVTACIEPLRRDKIIGSSLEADVSVGGEHLATVETLGPATDISTGLLAEVCIAASVNLVGGDKTIVTRTTYHKCGRCWRHLPEVTEDGDLCSRCDHVVAGMAIA